MTIVFNTLTCTMIIASMMIAVLVCEHVINEETSDGYTHTKGVSCVLYNQLFRVVTSSFIRKSLIKSLIKIELFSKTVAQFNKITYNCTVLINDIYYFIGI